jgi:hypothetical protein
VRGVRSHPPVRSRSALGVSRLAIGASAYGSHHRAVARSRSTRRPPAGSAFRNALPQAPTSSTDVATRPANGARSESLGRAATFATTEHFNLQTARAVTVSEANGRASIYLAALSSNLIALAFIRQMSRLGVAFFTFGLVLLPVLTFRES